MQKLMSMVLAWFLLGISSFAAASFHTFEIVQIYSNADGSIQYVVLHEYAGANGEQSLAGQTLTATRGSTTKTYVFPYDLPSSATAGRYVLIATQGYADAAAAYPQFAAARPDYVIPNQFIPTDGGALTYAGIDQVAFGPLPVDGQLALFTPATQPHYLAVNEARNFAGGVATLPTLAVTAVEYYNPSLRHYFITNLQPDIDALDTQRIPGWVRTGLSFYVWPSPAPGLSPVCRFYIPPHHGDSHFFSASQAECADVLNRTTFDPNYSGYVMETAAAFHIDMPNTITGSCPPGTIPVYRLWNARIDSNHRYTTDPQTKAQMIAIGYIAEGYGPNAVAMCSPL
jgi:hypothetical protein